MLNAAVDRSPSARPNAGDLANAASLVRHLDETSMFRSGEPYRPTGPFLEQLERSDSHWEDLSESSRAAAVVRFLSGCTGQLESELPRRQAIAMAENLSMHGTPASAERSYEALAKLSDENLPALLAPTGNIDPETKRLVESLQLLFIHNTNVIVEQPSIPLLSSRQLETLGLGGGANTHPFNRDALRTDDNVFFLPVLAHPHASPQSIARANSQYGENVLVLDEGYACERGIISFYCMTPDDLIFFAEIYDGTRRRQLLETKEALLADPETAPQWEALIVKECPEQLRAVREQMHRLDLTVPHFETFMKNRLMCRLDWIRRSDPGQFDHLARLLSDPSGEELTQFYREHFLKYLGFGELHSGQELKVPSGVPAPRLKLYKPDA
jgi:hypothetical protein